MQPLAEHRQLLWQTNCRQGRFAHLECAFPGRQGTSKYTTRVYTLMLPVKFAFLSLLVNPFRWMRKLSSYASTCHQYSNTHYYLLPQEYTCSTNTSNTLGNKIQQKLTSNLLFQTSDHINCLMENIEFCLCFFSSKVHLAHTSKLLESFVDVTNTDSVGGGGEKTNGQIGQIDWARQRR